MSKKIAFITLALLAVGFAILGRRLQPDFLHDLWSQLFWLCAGTLVTTFVLASILEHAAQRQRRLANAFAFRTFSADSMIKLQQIAGMTQHEAELLEAALAGNKQFAQAVAGAASMIAETQTVDPARYVSYYQDIAGDLRNFSRQYIRLFSGSRKDMVTNYRELTQLANLWRYHDEFSEGSRAYAASLKPDNADKTGRENAYQTQVLSARDALVKTANLVADLAAKVAVGKGFYD